MEIYKRSEVNRLKKEGKSYRKIQKEMGFKSIRSVQQYLRPLKLMGSDTRALRLWDYLEGKLDSKTANQIWHKVINLYEK